MINLPSKSIVPEPSSSTSSTISINCSSPRLGSNSSKIPFSVSIVRYPKPFWQQIKILGFLWFSMIKHQIFWSLLVLQSYPPCHKTEKLLSVPFSFALRLLQLGSGPPKCKIPRTLIHLNLKSRLSRIEIGTYLYSEFNALLSISILKLI